VIAARRKLHRFRRVLKKATPGCIRRSGFLDQACSGLCIAADTL
jgi:hypothetical protein